ncbi:MAG TPA: hypothetical protein VNE82_23105 [Candidatus Binataceae bacterium]|nr:hypothetical protein [Candidatus Binataceae bacterium]
MAEHRIAVYVAAARRIPKAAILSSVLGGTRQGKGRAVAMRLAHGFKCTS